MKLKLSEIVGNIEGIKALAVVELPIKVSYNIKRLVRKLQPEIDTYQEARNAIINELGELDEKTKETKVVDPEKLKEFAKRVTELLEVEVEIDFEPIKISDLGDIKVSSNALVDWMFEE